MKIIANQISLVRSSLRRFSNTNKNLKETDKQTTEPTEQYNYAKEKFDIVNNEKFISKIQKMEQSGKASRTFHSIRFPIFCMGSSLFLYHLWQQMPYGVIFRHTTISEYIPREHYYHAILLAPLSFQTTGHFLVYWPLLAVSTWYAAIYMNTKSMMLLYVTTSVLAAGVTFAYERYQNKKLHLNMISPKCVGAVTPLSFVSAFLAINPGYLILNQRMLPFFVIPALYYMYEGQELIGGYVTELNRPAHVAACIWGLVFGFAFKRFALKGII